MTDCPDENELALLAEDGLSTPARRALEMHLDGCAACTQLVAELAGLASTGVDVPSRYRVIRELGAGAMGVVWEAEDTLLHRRVALKAVKPGATGSQERRARVLREARALAQLHHPNVVAVYDAAEQGDAIYLALELVDGTNAREWLAVAPRTPAEILGVWKQAAHGLAAVHRAGIIHRDIKPDNVLVAADGHVLVGDFGLATNTSMDTLSELTATGALLGTPLYMSPEQLHGEPATARSDQFALCASLWEALSGRRPFAGSTIAALAIAMTERPRIPSGVDRRLFAVLARGLDADPQKRWADIDALVRALEARRGSRRAIPATVAAIAIAGGGATFAIRSRAAEEPAPVIASHAPATGLVASDAAVAVVDAAVPRPDAPAPAVDPVPGLLAAANHQLSTRDGAGCLRTLVKLPAIHDQAIASSVALVHAQCTMLTGKCDAGRAELETFGRAHAWSADRIRTAIGFANPSCPIANATPRTDARLQLLSALDNGGCRQVVADLHAHHIEFADLERLEITCEAREGDCKVARSRWHAQWPADAPAAVRQSVDDQFDQLFPRCR